MACDAGARGSGGRSPGRSPSEPRRLPRGHGARVIFNLADALVPPGAGEIGGGDVDVWPEVERILRQRGRRALLAASLLLAALEWRPVLALRRGRPFSRLPRGARRAELRRWEHSRLPALRSRYADLRRTVLAALERDPRYASARAGGRQPDFPRAGRAPAPPSPSSPA